MREREKERERERERVCELYQRLRGFLEGWELWAEGSGQGPAFTMRHIQGVSAHTHQCTRTRTHTHAHTRTHTHAHTNTQPNTSAQRHEHRCRHTFRHTASNTQTHSRAHTCSAAEQRETDPGSLRSATCDITERGPASSKRGPARSHRRGGAAPGGPAPSQ